MAKVQNMYWAPFLVRILDSTVFTRPPKKVNLTFNVFISDNNQTVI